MIDHQFLNNLRNSIRVKNDNITSKRIVWIKRNKYYYRQLLRSLKFIIEENSKVLHIRSGIGYILNELNPAQGVGIEDSAEQVREAKLKYPHLTFYDQCVENIDIEGVFDYILITSIEDIVDIVSVLNSINKNIDHHTRIILISYNFLWQPFVSIAEALRLKIPQKLHNWISYNDKVNLLELGDCEVVSSKKLILFPFNIPGLSFILNRFFARLPLIRALNLIRITIARPLINEIIDDFSVSVIIPCKNEAGNVREAVTRIPEMGNHTEIIFCDDKSTDGTPDIVKECMKEFPDKDIILLDGPGINKAENVWVGFDAAKGDILMILDGDLTVLPEELIYFYNTIATRKGEYINGSRLVYPPHENAMRLFNVFGNKFFSLFFSFILDTNIKDTLCGTKVLWKRDYERLKKYRGTWGVNDRWGDYEIIFGASKCNLKFIDLPVHYYERQYGETKMTNRFKNGWNMLKMSLAALFKIKFH